MFRVPVGSAKLMFAKELLEAATCSMPEVPAASSSASCDPGGMPIVTAVAAAAIATLATPLYLIEVGEPLIGCK